MPVTRRSGGDFSANVGLAVYQSAANTVALWADSTVEPFGIVDAVDEADPQDVTVAIIGDRTQIKVAAGGLAAGVGLVTTVGAGGKLTAPSAADYVVAQSLHKAAASENDLIEAVVTIGMIDSNT